MAALRCGHEDDLKGGVMPKDGKVRITIVGVVLGLVLVTLAAIYFYKPAKNLFSLPELLEVVEAGGGWVPLPMADSKMQPGSVIHLNADTGLRFLGYLGSCRVPGEVLEPVRGSAGKITFDKEIAYDADALLELEGVSAGPRFEKVKGVSFSVEDFGADAVDLLKLMIWLTDPDNADRVPAFCQEWLKQEDIYLISEAFRVSRGSYRLRDENGAELSLEDSGMLSGILKLDAAAKAKWTSAGLLEITEPVYIAIRKVRKLEDRFEVLSQPLGQDEYGDATLKDYIKGLAE